VDNMTDLERHLQRELNGRIADFRLDVQDAGLVLKGKAITYYGKQLAQHLTMEATSLPILANQIEVFDR
jgi:hypothetical protein